MSWIKFIKKIQNEYYIEDDEMFPKFDFYSNFQDLIDLKFNFDSKFDDICFKNEDKNIIRLIYEKNQNKFYSKVDETKFNTCPFFIHLMTKENNIIYEHLIVLIINQQSKEVIMYDSFDKRIKDKSTYNKLIKKVTKVIFKKNYKFKINKHSSNLDEQCVPNTFLFAYLFMKYKTDVNEFAKYMNEMSCKEKFELNIKFFKFLYN